jgi:Ala-tRNA(Pro) deacylase
VPATKIKEFLDSNHVRYSTLSHSVAYTAQEIASLAHIPGKELAKTVMVKLDGKLAMAVLPASNQVDLEALKNAAGAKEVRLSTESEFKYQFPDCEPGAMPPFGNLYDMPVFVHACVCGRRTDPRQRNRIQCRHTQGIDPAGV